MSSVEALKALTKIPIRFLGIEDNPAVREIYPITGTPITKKIFSIVGRADRLPQNVVMKFGVNQNQVTNRITLRVDRKESGLIDAEKLWAQKAIEGLEY